MLREIPPASFSQRRSLESVSTDASGQEPEKGSLSSDGTFCWMYRGSYLTVTSLERDNYTVSRGNFAELLEESSLHIQFVTQLKDHLSLTDSDYNPYILVVVLIRKVFPAAQIPTSVVCLYDARLKKILKAIDCPFVVRLAEPIIVSDAGRAGSLVACLNEQLQSFHGVIVLGSEGGLVSFVDLCLDQEVREVVPPGKLTFAVRSTASLSYDMETKRRQAIVHQQHISLPLNADCQSKHFFYYRSGGDEKSEARPVGRTFVTCIKYIPQINALCVAYNFGGYHVYDLKSLDLMFRGDTNIDTAVVNFSFQEPEEDPKNHCYLWMTRGPTVKEFIEDGVASVHLNVMTFRDKLWVEDFGYQYSNFCNSSCLFDYDCTGFPYLADRENCSYSVIINSGCLEQGSPWYYKASEDEAANDLSLFFVAWEATNDASDSPLTYFAIFDINQFYQAQMPRVFDVSKDNHLCPYFGIFSLSEVTGQLPNETILDFRIDANSIRRYRSSLYNHDLHYFPSSLSFEVCVLTEKSSLNASFLGLQNFTLAKVSASGSSILIDPKEALKNCFHSGLLPSPPPQETRAQRKSLLLVMLQNEQLPFLFNVIDCWSSREFDHIGCSLEFMLEWIWDQVSVLKTCVDQVSHALFPSSKEVFDENYGIKTLYSYEVDLNNLFLLINKILESASSLKTEVRLDIEKKKDYIEMICMYLRVMLWMIDCKLLPELSESESLQRPGIFSYQWAIFRSNYRERRKRLRQLNPSLKTTSFLIIDGIVESVKGPLCSFWKQSGGDSVFPPCSLHALLGIYLLENVPLDRKHEIVQYLLLDLAAIVPENQPEMLEKVKRFHTVMSLKQSLVEFVEGSWALDQGMFPFALQLLMRPGVKKDYFTVTDKDDENLVAFKSDVHHRVITSLVFQGESLMAQQFASVCKIKGRDVSSLKDFGTKVKAEVSMLLTNKQSMEALDLVRRYHDKEVFGDLFKHFLKGVEKTGQLKDILKLSLQDNEQEALQSFLLHSSSHPQSKKILLLHLLTQNQVMEANRVLDIIRVEGQSVSDPSSASLLDDLELLVDRYKKALPTAMSEMQATESNTTNNLNTIEDKREEERPQTPGKKSRDFSRSHAMKLRETPKKKSDVYFSEK